MPLTLHQKIEAIRQACIAANKSILDLKMGCHVLVKPKGNIFSATVLYRNYAGNYLLEMHGMVSTATFGKNQIVKIIGRDILLSDVLYAISKAGDNGDFEFGIRAGGDFLIDFCEKTAWDEEGRIAYHWNLLRPSLDGQEEATISFIYEILCAK